jgi:hypothetical protein
MYQTAMSVDPAHPNSMYNYAVLCDSGLGKQAEAEEVRKGRAAQRFGRR